MASTDELAQAGRTLAARLGAAPGFVACLILETLDGGSAAVCVWEDRASLEAADELIAEWSPVEGSAPWTDPPRQFTGEVVAQKGL